MSADFTSALFLGLGGPACPAGPLTSGKPAALDEPVIHRSVGACVARARGAAHGQLARTSLHALIDVLITIGRRNAVIVVDENLYPVGRWAVAVARAEGMTVITYRHLQARDATRALRAVGGRAVAVLTDGWCDGCLRPAPLPELRAAALRMDALLVVDDTLATGVLGTRVPGADLLGAGGQGAPAWLGCDADGIVCVASCAKAYAAPLAVITGPAGALAATAQDGPTRVHASPPTACDVHALRRALTEPTLDARRARLARLIIVVREHVRRLGLGITGLPFPIVAIPVPRRAALAKQEHLRACGVRTLITRSRCTGRTHLTSCLRADHSTAEIEALLAGLTSLALGEECVVRR